MRSRRNFRGHFRPVGMKRTYPASGTPNLDIGCHNPSGRGWGRFRLVPRPDRSRRAGTGGPDRNAPKGM